MFQSQPSNRSGKIFDQHDPDGYHRRFCVDISFALLDRVTIMHCIGVGSFRILGGPRFRILGGQGGTNYQQAHDVVTTSM